MSELQYFGWNLATLGFLGTVIFSLVRAWTFEEQRKLVWKHQSGESISILWLLYFIVLHGIVFVYGLDTQRLALMINGLLTVCALPLLVGLWKFQGLTFFEKMIGVASCPIFVFVCVTSLKEQFFFYFSLGGIVFSFLQPLEIWKNKSSGVVDVRFHAMSLLNAFFWFLYAHTMDIWVLQVTSYLYGAIAILTILLWHIYRSNYTRLSSQ